VVTGGRISTFIRKSAFENLVKRCESQQQQVENLNEMLGILAQSLGQQFEFNLGRGWNLGSIRPEHKYRRPPAGDSLIGLVILVSWRALPFLFG
jgi:hypothetical protein